jgi:hypothetical protein
VAYGTEALLTLLVLRLSVVDWACAVAEHIAHRRTHDIPHGHSFISADNGEEMVDGDDYGVWGGCGGGGKGGYGQQADQEEI